MIGRPGTNAGMLALEREQTENSGEPMTESAKNPKLEDHPGSNTQKDPDQWVSGDEPMTGAQASYLTTLSEEAGVEAPPQDLSKAEASKRIDELKARLGRG
jgi:Protein of unknown function (DUF3072)